MYWEGHIGMRGYYLCGLARFGRRAWLLHVVIECTCAFIWCALYRLPMCVVGELFQMMEDIY